MTCVDYTTWNNARAACQNLQQSVRGLGHNYAPTGLRAMRGLGSAAGLFAELSAAVAPAAPTPSTLDTSAASNPADPCVIAAQTPCPAKPPSLTAAPPPIVCGQGFFKTCNPAPCHCAPVTDTTVMTPTTSASTSTGGFSQWGLLAVLVVGGLVVYKVAKHKKASS